MKRGSASFEQWVDHNLDPQDDDQDNTDLENRADEWRKGETL